MRKPPHHRIAGSILCLLLLTGCSTFAPPPDVATPTILQPTAAPVVTVQVRADGSGDYPCLSAAIQEAPPEASIWIEPGTYVLDAPLEVSRPLTLLGAGMDQVEIVSSAPGYVARFSGSGPFVIDNVAFRYQGSEPADVVLVLDGQVAFTGCRFSGAVLGTQPGSGAGLRLAGDVTGTVESCLAVENGHAGILLQDQARPELVRNTCTGNEGVGILYWGYTGGVARENDCSRNGLEHLGIGISVAGAAQPVLEENICAQNPTAGISYFQQAGGTARRNRCTENGAGVVVSEQAQPSLEENECSGNESLGIVYFPTAGGVAQGNTCSQNGTYGILVYESAGPTLVDNICQDNGEADVADQRP